MQGLKRIDEFKAEAGDALFTKQQAIAVVENLFELEIMDAAEDLEKVAVLTEAVKRISIHYFDPTTSSTDSILDDVGVARITVSDIVEAMDAILFDVN